MEKPASDAPVLHRCGARRPVPVGTKVDRLPFRTIDVHCHVFSPAAEAVARAAPGYAARVAEEAAGLGEASQQVNNAQLDTLLPKLTSVDARLRDMDAMGVDIQLVSPSPTQYHYWAKADFADEIVRLQNDTVAALTESHPDRFLGLGAVSLQNPERAATQLEALMRNPQFKGVQISTFVQGRDLDDRAFDPFWATADRLGAVVFIHPWGTTLGPRLAQHYLMNTIGQPLETTVCLSKLIFSGTLERHKRLRIIAAHGGGYLPAYSGRSDHAHAVRPDAGGCACRPSEQLRRLWFDSVVHDPLQLRQLIERVGADRLVIGTDYPFDMGDYDPSGLVAALSSDIQRMVLGGNAAELLDLQIEA